LVTAEVVHELRQLIKDSGSELERVLAFCQLSLLEGMTKGTYRCAVELPSRKRAMQAQKRPTHAQD
jgi:hypothetical protein